MALAPSVTVDPASSLPPFEQLRRGFVDAIAAGELEPGDRLPTVRALATDLGLAPGTVARAFRELEASGVVETRGRHGTFVRTPDAAGAAKEAARAYAAHVRRLAIDEGEALEFVRAALRAQG